MSGTSEQVAMAKRLASRYKDIAVALYVDELWCEIRNDPDAALVDIRIKGSETFIHKSRNRFFPTTSPQQKHLWHQLATDSNLMLTLGRGWQASDRREKLPAENLDHNQMLAPSWIRESDIIGYTNQQAILLDEQNPLATHLFLSDEGIPSIYYKHCHASVDHSVLSNIGWKIHWGWDQLFFGNVPNEYL
ncbi:hypothetical protein [Kistimonas asteriae]|uniref:hypothetical protein n=1 Tax=Kistimonas asteriae TaxID=517724 RepID=UPI001BAD06E1|nr:hypothetical protein [Kistimonas asteriae]